MSPIWWNRLRLRSRKPEVRRRAIERLGARNTPRAFASLLACLQDADASVRCAATRALGSGKNDQGRHLLLSSLKDTSSEVRQTAARTLARHRHPATLGPLAGLLEDPEPNVRAAAAATLQQFGWHPLNPRQQAAFQVALGQIHAAALAGQVAVPPLLHQLQHHNYSVRCTVASALEHLSDPRTLQPLLAAVADPDPTVRVSVIHALGRNAEQAPTRRLLEKLTVDAHPKVRLAAAQVLARQADPALAECFVGLLRDTHFEVRQTAVEFLGKSRHPDHAPALLPLLSDRDADVRQAAAQALGRLANPMAVPALVVALSDEERAVRHAVSHALDRIDPNWMRSEPARRASSQLESRLQTRPAWVRAAVGHLVVQLRGPLPQSPQIS